MPTGVSRLYHPEQKDIPYPVELENSYFMVKLHEAQAFFQAGWLVKPGYYAAVSSQEDLTWQEGLMVRGDGPNRSLAAYDGDLERSSYAVIRVLAFKRRGEEMAWDEAWGEILQAGKEQALDACPLDYAERRKAWEMWRSTLAQAKRMAFKDRMYLKDEIAEIFKKAQLEVQKALMPSRTVEAYGDGEPPAAWQEILGVNTEQELYSSVKDYEEALEVSRGLVGG